MLTSAQGRTCLVPVHTGEAPLFADVSSNDWNDGDNVHLWSGTGGWNQSFWLHDLGTGYHMIVPECSGCALDLAGGGQGNGTNVAQWNCYGDWGNPNQHWASGRAAVPRAGAGCAGAFRIDSSGEGEGAGETGKVEGASDTADAGEGGTGEVEPGAVLSPTDPDRACLPRNYPGTAGMGYRYAWYRGAAPGERAEP